MNKPYIYEPKQNADFNNALTALVVLPDIFGFTDYAKATADQFAKRLGQPVYMLDYFYEVTHKSTVLDPTDQNQMDQALNLMADFKGEQFLKIFNQALNDIKTTQPSLQNVTALGFCFAGRLVYLTAQAKVVDKIISFYGAGANNPNFVESGTAVEFLMSQNRPDIKVLSFYGVQDESIPEDDRNKTNDLLAQAGVDYTHKEYVAGHAYFQPGRPNYDESAAKGSWQVLEEFVKWANNIFTL